MQYYKVIKHKELEFLVEEVNNAIKAGWIPQGGITTIFTDFGPNGKVMFLQAMTQNLNK